jgi:hypothetical protein
MSDPRFQSLHLEGQPRQALFRAARAAVEAACGMQTLAGDLHAPAPAPAPAPARLDATTCAPAYPAVGPASRFAFYLKDGQNIYPLHLGLNTVGRLPDNDVVRPRWSG